MTEKEVKEIARLEIRDYHRWLKGTGQLITPLGHGEIRELDPDTLEPITEPTLDPKGELPDDIIQGLKKK
jgi:hypothetical protein